MLETEQKVLEYLATTTWALENAIVPTSATLLNGGTCNYVWRIATTTKNQTFIVKNFPPFVRAAPNLAFSQDRANLEFIALSAAHKQFNNEAAAAWSSPEPYFFDPEAFVLVLQDMPGTGLFELLKKTAEKPQTIQAKDIDWIATAMIDFLFKIKDLNVPDISLFQNSPLIPVMNRMYSRNLAIAESYGIENGEEWQSRAAANDGINATSSFSFGDFWPNSVLVDLENKRIGIIDWELGRTGHYGQDLTQMLANLCLMKYAKSFDGEAVGSLEKKVCDAWREKRGELDDEGFDFQAGLVKRVLQLSRVHAADVDDMGIILRQEIENSSALLSNPLI